MLILRGSLVVAFLLATLSCASVRNVSGSRLHCHLDAGSQVSLPEPPSNAAALRNLARQYPNDPDSFGPPPFQQLFSGLQWDRRNEYWYADEAADLYLYSNTDDFYVYYWHFAGSSEPKLEDHGLLDCAN